MDFIPYNPIGTLMLDFKPIEPMKMLDFNPIEVAPVVHESGALSVFSGVDCSHFSFVDQTHESYKPDPEEPPGFHVSTQVGIGVAEGFEKEYNVHDFVAEMSFPEPEPEPVFEPEPPLPCPEVMPDFFDPW